MLSSKEKFRTKLKHNVELKTEKYDKNKIFHKKGWHAKCAEKIIHMICSLICTRRDLSYITQSCSNQHTCIYLRLDWLFTRTDSLYHETSLEPLHSRRHRRKLQLLYRLYNGFAPQYLHDLIPPTIQSTTIYSLRNGSDLIVSFCRLSSTNSLLCTVYIFRG